MPRCSSLPPAKLAVCEDTGTARGRIRDLLAGDALGVAYQPVVDIRSGLVVGAEALARFHVEPYRTPDVWFGEAWSAGLGLELELKAVDRALTNLSAFPEGTYVAVNTAPATMCSDALLDLLRKFPTERVVVELTEHTRVDDYDALVAGIARLRQSGARLSIDDAGAGFSSFQHVLRLEPDIIKLDRSLTKDIDQNRVRAALATALVTFADSLGAQICAEGIETVDELATLQKLGIAYGQGYFLGRPAALPLAPPPSGIWTTRYARPGQARKSIPSPTVLSAQRLDALDHQDLLAAGESADFDRFTRLAVKLLGAPVALLSMIDKDRQHFISALGLPDALSTVRETPLTHSFCQHAVTTRLPLVIDDARNHPLVRSNGAVNELGVAAYAGVPILTPNGHALGALCVLDLVPRTWTEEQIASLQDLTTLLMAQLELRRIRREHAATAIEG